MSFPFVVKGSNIVLIKLVGVTGPKQLIVENGVLALEDINRSLKILT